MKRLSIVKAFLFQSWCSQQLAAIFNFEIMDAKTTSNLLSGITIIPELMGGKPAIRGMRFPVDILEMLDSVISNGEILEQHPVLRKKT